MDEENEIDREEDESGEEENGEIEEHTELPPISWTPS